VKASLSSTGWQTTLFWISWPRFVALPSATWRKSIGRCGPIFEIATVSRLELVERLKTGLVTVLDVRPEDEFALGHLQGAISIPLAQLKKRLAELDYNKEIIAYCRGSYCLSYEAVAALRGARIQGSATRGWIPGMARRRVARRNRKSPVAHCYR
jgi:rhodanese-related sulfurtransferase